MSGSAPAASGVGDESGRARTSDLGIDAADLRSSAPVFQAQAVALAGALSALEGSLGALGKPWGDDDQGKQFEAAYGPRVKTVEKAAGILVLGLTSIHEAMVDMSDGFVDNEDLIRGMFTKADARVGAEAQAAAGGGVPGQGGDGPASQGRNRPVAGR
ncbi:hypothetical protein [Streptomyces sp. DW26H14]|uniref:hypothetical protein n=1 Tax=Streptomyces sp. DW26H14 TaxID=3435395 RepID=UPI00403E221B